MRVEERQGNAEVLQSLKETASVSLGLGERADDGGGELFWVADKGKEPDGGGAL